MSATAEFGADVRSAGDAALDLWLQAGLRRAYHDAIAEPVPDELLSLCRSAPAPAAARAA